MGIFDSVKNIVEKAVSEAKEVGEELAEKAEHAADKA